MAWFGGFFERLLRVVKTQRKEVLGRSLLHCKELETVDTVVETFVNSPPVTGAPIFVLTRVSLAIFYYSVAPCQHYLFYLQLSPASVRPICSLGVFLVDYKRCALFIILWV